MKPHDFEEQERRSHEESLSAGATEQDARATCTEFGIDYDDAMERLQRAGDEAIARARALCSAK